MESGVDSVDDSGAVSDSPLPSPLPSACSPFSVESVVFVDHTRHNFVASSFKLSIDMSAALSGDCVVVLNWPLALLDHQSQNSPAS